MIFSTPTFIFAFLPIVLAVYYASPPRIRNLILFLGSLIFYAWGEPVYITIMLFSTVFDYMNGILIVKFKDAGQIRRARLVLINAIIINLSILAFFKYSNFFITNVNHIFSSNIGLLNLALPIGISFYTFQTMSYTIDVYREDVDAQKNIIDFGAYVTLFPQLVAGPIVRYKDIAAQLECRKETIDSFSYGVRKFIIGLFKKVMLANNVGLLWEQISSAPIDTLPVLTAWLGAIAFTFQIYFDFSGYSDMAIGLGSMFGFTFLENFDYPYTSKSITEFWRRWHISLGTWFKEYVYIPLGGSRQGKLKLIRNLLIVWSLTGFWHGASWNFIFWGMYFGIILILEKTFLLKYLEKIPFWLRHVYTLVLIVFSWIIFAFEDISKVGQYLKTMLGLNQSVLVNYETTYLLSTNWILLFFCIASSTKLIKFILNKVLQSKCKNSLILGESIVYIFMLFISICFLIGASYNPFLYFRF
jgi:alginate O-acetyltransferase complex protein AlgI